LTGGRRVLVVEDEAHMRRFLRTTLGHNGFEVVDASTGAQALEQAFLPELGVILLDLGLPDLDGVEVVRRVRAKSDVPIIVISARWAEDMKIEALDGGANDYVTKPFQAGELLARIRAALRTSAQGKSPPVSAVVVGDLQIDLEGRIVRLGTEEIHLTPTEYGLLALLATRVGRVVTHRELLRGVWGEDSTNQTEYLRVYMRQLRYKLEREPSRPRYLVTVPGVGYRLLGD